MGIANYAEMSEKCPTTIGVSLVLHFEISPGSTKRKSDIAHGPIRLYPKNMIGLLLFRQIVTVCRPQVESISRSHLFDEL